MGSILRVALTILPLTAALAAQVTPLERVVEEAVRLRGYHLDPDAASTGYESSNAKLRATLRHWIELCLPESRSDMAAVLPGLQAAMKADLWRAHLLLPEQSELTEFGYVDDIAITRSEEAPDVVIVRAGVHVPCGSEDDVYIYDYSDTRRRIVLESPGDFARTSNVSISQPDSAGNRLILINRLGVQCQGTYYGMDIELFQWSVASYQASRVLVTQDAFWLGPGEPPVRLTANELLFELVGNRIDTARRTHVLRYRVGPTGAERIDPVALQPHDFVDEWLTRPWNEMESRSAGKDLKKWHELLHGEYIGGQFAFSQSGSEDKDQWEIGLAVDTLQGKELPEPLPLYFTVHALPEHSYRMTGISFARPDGCPGNAPVTEDMPSLFSTASKQ